MTEKLAREGTHLREMVDLMEDEIRKMGGELPPHPDDDDDYEEDE